MDRSQFHKRPVVASCGSSRTRARICPVFEIKLNDDQSEWNEIDGSKPISTITLESIKLLHFSTDEVYST